jgi:hypothetical protein
MGSTLSEVAGTVQFVRPGIEFACACVDDEWYDPLG